MGLASILNGDYIVWHGQIAQIDIKLTPQLSQANRLDLILGVNCHNSTPQVKLYYKPGVSEDYVYLATMSPITTPIIPGDGTFIDTTYSVAFSSRIATYFRIIVSKDGILPQELTPIKKYIVYNNNSAVVGGSAFLVNDLGWKTGEVFKTIFKYLEAPISTEHKVDIEAETVGDLPETRIRNENLLARLADNERIIGNWKFAGTLAIPTLPGLMPPLSAPNGQIMQLEDSDDVYIGTGDGIVKILTANNASENAYQFAQAFTHNNENMLAGAFLSIGSVTSSPSLGMVIPKLCALVGASLIVDNNEPVLDSSGVEICVNGGGLATLALPNNVNRIYSNELSVSLNPGDYVSVRCTVTNNTALKTPIVMLYFK